MISLFFPLYLFFGLAVFQDLTMDVGDVETKGYRDGKAGWRSVGLMYSGVNSYLVNVTVLRNR